MNRNLKEPNTGSSFPEKKVFIYKSNLKIMYKYIKRIRKWKICSIMQVVKICLSTLGHIATLKKHM